MVKNNSASFLKNLGVTLGLFCLINANIQKMVIANDDEFSDCHGGPEENQCLEFPMIGESFKSQWNSLGSAIFFKNKAVLVPEISGAKGAIHTTYLTLDKEKWHGVLEF